MQLPGFVWRHKWRVFNPGLLRGMEYNGAYFALHLHDAAPELTQCKLCRFIFNYVYVHYMMCNISYISKWFNDSKYTHTVWLFGGFFCLQHAHRVHGETIVKKDVSVRTARKYAITWMAAVDVRKDMEALVAVLVGICALIVVLMDCLVTKWFL